MHPPLPGLFNQVTEMGIHFGSAAGQIECLNAGTIHQADQGFRRFPSHVLTCLGRTRLDMTMDASEIAQLAKIDLENLNRLLTEILLEKP